MVSIFTKFVVFMVMHAEEIRVLIICFFCVSVMQVVMKQESRLCSTKPIVTVNGEFPGPTLYAREGDTVLVRVVNQVKYNVSIHWYV